MKDEAAEIARAETEVARAEAEAQLLEVLGDDLVDRLARASREYGVMITISVSPLADAEDGD